MRRTPPDANRALQAAWQNFSAADAGAAEVPSLLLMADALKALNRPAQAIQALEAAAERAPDNKAIVQKLDETRRATGMLVRRVATEPEAEPPRACIDFTVAPARRDDFHAEDWVRLDPPRPGRRGHPRGRPDLRLRPALRRHHADHAARRHAGRGRPQPDQGHALNIAMANRQPAHRLRHAHVRAAARADAGDRPEHGQPLQRQADAGAADRAQRRRASCASAKLGQPVDTWDAERIGEQTGRIVWQGSADIPKWQPNRSAHTALPMPDALATSGPGLYALIARAGDGTPNAPAGVQMILRTDFAPTVWRGTDGLTVQVRGYSDVQPRAGVTLRAAGREQRDPRRDHHRCRRRRPLCRAAAARRGAGGAARARGVGRRGLHRCST